MPADSWALEDCIKLLDGLARYKEGKRPTSILISNGRISIERRAVSGHLVQQGWGKTLVEAIADFARTMDAHVIDEIKKA